MRLSRLRRMVSSQIGFFPDVPKYDLYDMKYALNRHSGRTDEFPELPANSFPMYKLYQHLNTRFWTEKPKYAKTINQGFEPFKLAKIEKGMVLDAESILSIFPPDLRVHLSKTKYIMVCSFLLPLLRASEVGSYTNALISVTSELRDQYGSDFEMVLVAMMRQGWLKHKPSFDHFFSAFPSFCRVIPFSDLNTRHHLCNLLFHPCYSRPRFLLLERSSESTSTYSVLNYRDTSIFNYHGADDFPFTDEMFRGKVEPSFNDILDRISSHIQVSRFSTSSGGESVSLSELQGKVVGLYLCFDGSLMLKLDQVCRDCRERGLEFEVVLVYMPFQFLCNVNTLMENINDALHYLPNAQSWWIMPYVDSISRKLWRISPSCTNFGYNEDRLIIFGPHREYVDPNAGEILRKYGVDVYPFTCERLTEWRLEKIRSLTLESLLVHGSCDFVLGKGSNGGLERVPVKQLRGRVILLCFEYNWPEKDPRLLLKYYDKIKSRHPNFEAVHVPLNPDASVKPYDVGACECPPWLVCPLQPNHRSYIEELLGSPLIQEVVFGEDGRVCSIRAEELLLSKGVDAFPFNVDLRREVTLSLADDNDNWTIREFGNRYC